MKTILNAGANVSQAIAHWLGIIAGSCVDGISYTAGGSTGDGPGRLAHGADCVAKGGGEEVGGAGDLVTGGVLVGRHDVFD